MIAQEELLDLLTYRDGRLFWNARVRGRFATTRAYRSWNSRYAGTLAGRGVRGYWDITLLGRKWGVHRVIWVMHHGVWPSYIDHIDGNPSNNLLDNLRSVTHRENLRNCRRRKENKTGISGVRHISKTTWSVSINGSYIGYFDNFFDACCARKSAELTHNYHPNHGRSPL